MIFHTACAISVSHAEIDFFISHRFRFFGHGSSLFLIHHACRPCQILRAGHRQKSAERFIGIGVARFFPLPYPSFCFHGIFGHGYSLRVKKTGHKHGFRISPLCRQKVVFKSSCGINLPHDTFIVYPGKKNGRFRISCLRRMLQSTFGFPRIRLSSIKPPKVQLSQVQPRFIIAHFPAQAVAVGRFFLILFQPVSLFQPAADNADFMSRFAGTQVGRFTEISDRFVDISGSQGILPHGIIVFHHSI